MDTETFIKDQTSFIRKKGLLGFYSRLPYLESLTWKSSFDLNLKIV